MLRVCADPANLPYSNHAGRGFENKLAAFVARAVHARLDYAWSAQRRGFIRNTLDAGACDVLMGVPVGLAGVRTTRAYYRSTFAFVSRLDRPLSGLRSIVDPRLSSLRVGVPLAGDDGANPAPVVALSRRGIVANLTGFSLWVHDDGQRPPRDRRGPHAVRSMLRCCGDRWQGRAREMGGRRCAFCRFERSRMRALLLPFRSRWPFVAMTTRSRTNSMRSSNSAEPSCWRSCAAPACPCSSYPR